MSVADSGGGWKGIWARPATLLAFGRGLRSRREALGMTLDVLARETGISKPYLSNIETARAPGPPSEGKLRKLAGALAISAEELLAGADWLRAPESIRRALAAAAPAAGGERDKRPRRADGTVDLDVMMEGGGGREVGRGAHPSAVAGGLGGGGGGGVKGEVIGVRAVPLINRVAAGVASEFGDLSYPAGVADAYVPAPDLPEAPVASAFGVRVVGDSMMPEYREGEILIVGPGGGEAKDGDDCVVRLGELEGFATTFKRVFFVEEEGVGGVRLVPLNPAHGERVVSLERVTGIYPVIYRVMAVGRGAAPEVRQGFTSTRVEIEND